MFIQQNLVPIVTCNLNRLYFKTAGMGGALGQGVTVQGTTEVVPNAVELLQVARCGRQSDENFHVSVGDGIKTGEIDTKMPGRVLEITPAE
jgi:hypothetical protein